MILLSLNRSSSRRLHPSFVVMNKNKRKALSSASEPTEAPPVYRAQGLVAVHKPLTWTSQDVGEESTHLRSVV